MCLAHSPNSLGSHVLALTVCRLWVGIIWQGFSFSGEVREPFPAVIKAMEEAGVPVTSVDAPSSWNIDEGPPKSGVGSSFHPDALVSLTAPKPLVQFLRPTTRHFIGGRCVAFFFFSVSFVSGCCRDSPFGLSSLFSFCGVFAPTNVLIGLCRRPLPPSTTLTCPSIKESIRSLKSTPVATNYKRKLSFAVPPQK